MVSTDIGVPRADAPGHDGPGLVRLAAMCTQLRTALRLADEGREVLLGAKLQDVLSAVEERAMALGGDPAAVPGQG